MKQNAKLVLIDKIPYILVGESTVIPPNQIGFIVEILDHETPTEFWQSEIKYQIDEKYIEKIIKNNGECQIEMQTYIGDGCGYRLPKLIDDKVIIYL